jgi:DNA adenine methylase
MCPPTFSRYFEPFAGSAALFFALAPSKALLSDTNAQLINTYVQTRRHPTALHHSLTSIPRSKKQYLAFRKQNPNTLPAIQRALRFLYLNRYCFNGLYRTNTSGEFNVPYSAARTNALPPLSTFLASAKILRSASLAAADFELSLSTAGKDDFAFLDPPYAITTSRVFRQYHKLDFTPRDVPRLRDCLNSLDRRNVRFMMTYAYSPETAALFKKWHQTRLTVHRNIAGFCRHRRMAEEIVVSNYCPSTSRQLT